MTGDDFNRIRIVVEALHRHREFQELLEGDIPFLIYRTDTGVVLARNIYGFEEAKKRASEIRKKYSLKWEQVKFKADRSKTSSKSYPQSSGRRIEYASRYNPSKRKRFSGYYDSQGNYHDID